MRLFREMPPVMDVAASGLLRAEARSLVGFRPIPRATVTVRDMNGALIEQLQTDESGNTPSIEVPAPPLEYSLEPESPQPYSEYTLELEGEGVQTVTVEGTQVLPNETAIQQLFAEDEATANLTPPVPVADETLITIGPNTLYGDYPPKQPEGIGKTAESRRRLCGPGRSRCSRIHCGPRRHPRLQCAELLGALCFLYYQCSLQRSLFDLG